ncbi:MAG: TRAP transporter substrate-binding protein DctP, partial [Lentisphaeraceae bacterium]|nr:TRAP transporter substrate-binding protein DctP [Lentisphaeraceae bacterium]
MKNHCNSKPGKYVGLLLLSFVLLLNSCNQPNGIKPELKRVLRLAHTLPETHLVHKSMLFMAKRIAEKSQGQIEVKIFSGGQLGKESDAVALVQLGCLDMTKVSAAARERTTMNEEATIVTSVPDLLMS